MSYTHRIEAPHVHYWRQETTGDLYLYHDQENNWCLRSGSGLEICQAPEQVQRLSETQWQSLLAKAPCGHMYDPIVFPGCAQCCENPKKRSADDGEDLAEDSNKRTKPQEDYAVYLASLLTTKDGTSAIDVASFLHLEGSPSLLSETPLNLNKQRTEGDKHNTEPVPWNVQLTHGNQISGDTAQLILGRILPPNVLLYVSTDIPLDLTTWNVGSAKRHISADRVAAMFRRDDHWFVLWIDIKKWSAFIIDSTSTTIHDRREIADKWASDFLPDNTTISEIAQYINIPRQVDTHDCGINAMVYILYATTLDEDMSTDWSMPHIDALLWRYLLSPVLGIVELDARSWIEEVYEKAHVPRASPLDDPLLSQLSRNAQAAMHVAERLVTLCRMYSEALESPALYEQTRAWLNISNLRPWTRRRMEKCLSESEASDDPNSRDQRRHEASEASDTASQLGQLAALVAQEAQSIARKREEAKNKEDAHRQFMNSLAPGLFLGQRS
ncbi:hypothetical protein FB567DRAFT_612835 [Paraphoma chrysanthemicola]|uniref:Ubiquitin-like protease family profile domain-containing protein n=1 Tax=Paraphoma chrysanthemicola TaxID=798071 RepID=A0A8K0QTU8_9PLEO|nr:hypothetical protein FB567DRAFT_612835 [Paraphoma chrysanthemicola]